MVVPVPSVAPVSDAQKLSVNVAPCGHIPDSIPFGHTGRPPELGRVVSSSLERKKNPVRRSNRSRIPFVPFQPPMSAKERMQVRAAMVASQMKQTRTVRHSPHKKAQKAQTCQKGSTQPKGKGQARTQQKKEKLLDKELEGPHFQNPLFLFSPQVALLLLRPSFLGSHRVRQHGFPQIPSNGSPMPSKVARKAKQSSRI